MKKVMFVLLFAALIMGGFTSCNLVSDWFGNGDDVEALIGTWAQQGSTATVYIRWEFKADNTYRVYSEVNNSIESGTWSLSGSTLTIDEEVEISISDDKNSLSMTFEDDNTYNYTRYTT